jgi:hypothetical protein
MDDKNEQWTNMDECGQMMCEYLLSIMSGDMTVG